MIIYNKTWLKNLAIQEDLKKAHHKGDITTEELKNIEEKYPVGFYSPNLFIRIGLFILTCVIFSFGLGLISLFLYDHISIDAPAYSIALGLITYGALELFVYHFHHYRSGIDDSLLWIAAGFLLTACILFQERELFPLATSGFIFIIAGYFTLRFADLLMAIVTFLALIAFIFFSIQSRTDDLSPIPFIIILSSIGIYFISTRWIKRFINYTNCLLVIQIAALFMTYAAGNYFVVRELGNEMSEIPLEAGESLPFGWFFWFWTAILPLVYIGLGIKRKDLILLRSGLLLVAIAAFTFRSYYHVMPIEGTLSIVGILLLGISYGVIRYLKTPRHGFTYEEQDEDHLMDKIKVESLIVSETFSGQQGAPEQSRMGGGSFGGGGAGSDF